MNQRPPYLIVAERADHALFGRAASRTPDEYLEGKSADTLAENVTVVNLCRSYHYLSRGYYVSLLADARNQQALPSLRLIEEITNPYAYFLALRAAGVETIDFKVVKGRRVLPKLIVAEPRGEEPSAGPGESLLRGETVAEPARYEPAPGEHHEVTAVFGRTLDPRFRRHCASVFRVYPFPILRIRIYRDEDLWKVGQIYPLSLGQIGDAELQLLKEELAAPRFAVAAPAAARSAPYRIAVLMDAEDPFAPSDEETFAKLERTGERSGVLYEEIGKDDLPILAEYDALFIRTVTGMDHYSFLFAQRAKSLGIPVIDDPQSTVRCSNKVYLTELFRKAGLPTPKTLTISRRSPLEEAEALGYPLIVKQPDGTFSAAVKKAADRQELEQLTRLMFKRSPLLTLQEYQPTEFDWRVGVLDGSLLYVCKYYMVKGHWQIVSKSRSGRPRYGSVEAVPLEGVPDRVAALAVEAAALIGDGLYGVDVKETDAGPVIIEINDNPDLWVGEEDAVVGERLYAQITSAFLRRIQESTRTPE